jgi:hypothetical protein
MAVTAKFVADFSEFHNEVQKGEAELKSFGDTAVTQTSLLQNLKTEFLSGFAEGVVKELDAMSKAAPEASKGLATIQPAAKSAAGDLDQVGRLVGVISERMLILGAIRGGFQFVEDMFEDAKKLEEVSGELGLTTDAVQKLQGVAREATLPFSLFSGAIDDMRKHIVSGDGGGAALAIQTLGLNLDDLRQKNPGDEFDKIALALSNVQDGATRAGLEVQIFGTDKLDPAIAKIVELESASQKLSTSLSKDQVKALADVAKGWDSALDAAKKYFSGIAANALLAGQGNGGATDSTVGRAGGVLAALSPLLPLSMQGAIGGTYSGPTASQDQSFIAAQLRNIAAERTAPTSGQFFGASVPMGMAPGYIDPATKAGWEAIQAIERSLTNETQTRIAAEKDEAALQKDMFNSSLEIAKKITAEFKDQIASLAKGMDSAIQASLAARTRNQAALGFDVAGNRLGSPGSIGSPEDTFDKTMQGIQNLKEQFPGLDTAPLIEDANNQLVAAQKKAAESATVFTMGMNDAFNAGEQLATSAKRGATTMDAVTDQWRTKMGGYADSLTAAAQAPGSLLGFSTGQMVQSIPLTAGRGWVSPFNNNSGSTVNVNVSGILDPATKTDLANMIGQTMLRNTNMRSGQ